MDGHTDIQHETIIPRHYRVVGLKMYMYQKVLSVNINTEGGKKKRIFTLYKCHQNIYYFFSCLELSVVSLLT